MFSFVCLLLFLNCLLFFFRQTGHVTVDVELMTPTHCESCCMVQQMIGVAITDALKNVDCDLPPIGELCGPQSQVGKIGSSNVIFKKIKNVLLYSQQNQWLFGNGCSF